MSAKPASRPTPGDLGWFGLILYIVGYDSWAIWRDLDTMSQSFDRSLRHPVRGPLTAAVWALVTAHLFEKAARRLLHPGP